jgi:hypothetical protein
MPAKPTSIPPITPVTKDLTVEAVRLIVECAEREEQRRNELISELRTALDNNDIPQVLEIARRICGMQEAAL